MLNIQHDFICSNKIIIDFTLYGIIDKICFFFLISPLILTIVVLPDSSEGISDINYEVQSKCTYIFAWIWY